MTDIRAKNYWCKEVAHILPVSPYESEGVISELDKVVVIIPFQQIELTFKCERCEKIVTKTFKMQECSFINKPTAPNKFYVGQDVIYNSANLGFVNAVIQPKYTKDSFTYDLKLVDIKGNFIEYAQANDDELEAKK